MITIEQCRAARGLLDWTQQDLAEASGLSKTAINNFEKGHSDIKYESLKALRMAFEAAGVEFMGDNGVRRKAESMHILKGPDALTHLLDDIYETLKQSGGEIMLACMDTSINPEKQAAFASHIMRLKRPGIAEKIICSETLMTVLAPRGLQCRCLPDAALRGTLTTAIYGGKVGIEFWGGSMIAIIESTDAHEAERRRFEVLWREASIPRATTFSLPGSGERD